MSTRAHLFCCVPAHVKLRQDQEQLRALLSVSALSFDSSSSRGNLMLVSAALVQVLQHSVCTKDAAQQ